MAHHDLVVSLRDLAVFTSGVVGGGQLCMLLVVVTAAGQLPVLESVRLHQTIMSTDLPDRYIQPAGILTFVLGGVLLGVGPRRGVDVALIVTAMAAIVGIAVLTRAINRPINRQLSSWTEQDLDDYPTLRRRWDRSHAARTMCGLLSFVAYIVLAAH